MVKNTILLVGDSWGMGEVVPDSDGETTHGGLAEYLRDYGYHVRNLSYPGGSNLQSCSRLKNYLYFNPTETNSIKAVVFLQTEFFREIWYYSKQQRDDELSQGYSVLKSRWIASPYFRLSEISCKWNIPIYVMGGSSDANLYDGFEEDFPGVKIICQSLVNYLLTGNHKISDPVYTEYINGWTDEFLTLIKPHARGNDLEQLIYDIDLGQQRLHKMHSAPEIFFPDGIHPNKFGHKLAFDLLLEAVPEIKNYSCSSISLV